MSPNKQRAYVTFVGVPIVALYARMIWFFRYPLAAIVLYARWDNRRLRQPPTN